MKESLLKKSFSAGRIIAAGVISSGLLVGNALGAGTGEKTYKGADYAIANLLILGAIVYGIVQWFKKRK
jgi:hypothetical protein